MTGQPWGQNRSHGLLNVQIDLCGPTLKNGVGSTVTVHFINMKGNNDLFKSRKNKKKRRQRSMSLLNKCQNLEVHMICV